MSTTDATQVNNTADNPEVVARHAAGVKRIAELEKELADLTKGNEDEAHRLSSIREPWLNKLEHMVSHTCCCCACMHAALALNLFNL
jgi:DNA repair ATPase RecN